MKEINRVLPLKRVGGEAKKKGPIIKVNLDTITSIPVPFITAVTVQ